MRTALFAFVVFTSGSASPAVWGSPVTAGEPWPASLHALAELAPGLPPDGLGPWLAGALYVAGVFFFVIKGINESLRLFGRKPAVDDEIRRLEKKMDEAVQHQDVRRAGNTRDLFDAIEESKNETNNRLGQVERMQDVLDERTKTTNHKIDSVEGKMDRLLSAVGRKGLP